MMFFEARSQDGCIGVEQTLRFYPDGYYTDDENLLAK